MWRADIRAGPNLWVIGRWAWRLARSQWDWVPVPGVILGATVMVIACASVPVNWLIFAGGLIFYAACVAGMIWKVCRGG
jgi:chromate transport protein ChrA